MSQRRGAVVRSPMRGLRALGALVGLVAPLLVTSSAGAEPTVTRTFTASETFVVPAGVTSIQVVAIGGKGGENERGVLGGEGAKVAGTLSVTPGNMLNVNVGREGAKGERAGGGGGGEGGRASDVRSGSSLETRLIVAGAGGGAGGESPTGAFPENSGRGGNAEQPGGASSTSRGGEPGTQTAGGKGGEPISLCIEEQEPGSGELGAGGFSGTCEIRSHLILWSGEGGGGYYGGGGGGAGDGTSETEGDEGGGGGGSSLVPSGGTAALTSEPAQVQISYVQPPNPPAVLTAQASNLQTTEATLNATVNPEDAEVTACTFEYGATEAYGQTAPCSPSPGSGVAPVAVSATVSGLSESTSYHFRIVATNANGTSMGSDGTFTTIGKGAPSVTSVSPSIGPAAGGTELTITGSRFEEASAVKFGSANAASFTVKSDGSITAVSPAGSGTVDVTVTTPLGTSPVVSADHFTFVPRPVVARVQPPGGPESGGNFVSIEGSNLKGLTSGSAHVYFGSTPATVKFESSSQLNVDAPAGTGTVDVTVTVPGGGTSATGPADRYTYETGAPEWGRCVFTSLAGSFTKNNCITQGKGPHYNWEPEVIKTGFAGKGARVTLESTAKVKVTCTAASDAGSIAGQKGVTGVVIRLAGCASGTSKCTTPGAAEGELESASLEGTLGWQNKAQKKAALDLYPAGHTGSFLAYTCAGKAPTTLSGSVLVPVAGDKMATTEPLKFVATAGKQKPEKFEGGEADVLKNQLSEQVGLTVTLTQTNEEKVEIDKVV